MVRSLFHRGSLVFDFFLIFLILKPILKFFRIFFIGAKEKQMPDLVAMINYQRLTPIPALLCTVGCS